MGRFFGDWEAPMNLTNDKSRVLRFRFRATVNDAFRAAVGQFAIDVWLKNSKFMGELSACAEGFLTRWARAGQQLTHGLAFGDKILKLATILQQFLMND
ncbi:MAG TPA: hypothetical protein VNW30_02575 [Opitutaceae bacterium]|jgi:hypothetical protein|nr:hypothetical protein [Opitutaceae bacterium]